MFSVAVATVLFPALSRLVARQDWDGLRATQANGIRQIALLLIPSAAVTIALAEPITRLVYERGEFDAESTAPGLRGAVLVLLLAAVLRLQPAAHAHVLLAPEAVDADRAGGRDAGDQRGRVGRAVRADGDRRHRARHGRLDRGDDRRAGVLPAPAHRRPPARHDAEGEREDGRGRRGARRHRLRHVVRARRRAGRFARRPDRLRRRRAGARRAPRTPRSCSRCGSRRRTRSSSCSRAACASAEAS